MLMDWVVVVFKWRVNEAQDSSEWHPFILTSKPRHVRKKHRRNPLFGQISKHQKAKELSQSIRLARQLPTHNSPRRIVPCFGKSPMGGQCLVGRWVCSSPLTLWGFLRRAILHFVGSFWAFAMTSRWSQPLICQTVDCAI